MIPNEAKVVEFTKTCASSWEGDSWLQWGRHA